MIRTFLLATYRGFLKHKSSFFINLIGLSTGLLCTLLIYLWVNDEYQVDRFHEADSRLYRVMEHQRYADGHVMTTWSTPGILGPELMQEVPEVEYAINITWPWEHLLTVDEKNLEELGYYADEHFFKMFSFPLKEGDVDQVLEDRSSIVISESLAEKLFKDQSPVGKLIQVDKEKSFRVSGVFEDAPANSTMTFEYVMHFDVIRESQSWLNNWGSNGPRTTALLKPGTNVEHLNARIVDFIKQRNEGSVVDLFFYPYSESYLHGTFKGGVLTGGRIEYVRLFGIIAIFILLIACINFMNLSTAKASRKAREVGIRKAIGADRKTLIGQYLTESVIISLLSLILAVVMIPVVLPFFNELTDKQIQMDLSLGFLGILLAVVLVTGLLAGSYPALYLSSFRPARIMKNEIKTSVGEVWARKGLVVFQFVLTVFLIVAVAVIYSQIQFVQNKNLGYNKENLIRFDMIGEVEENEVFLEALRSNPRVVAVAASGHTFTGRNNNTSSVSWPTKLEDEIVLFETMRSDYDLLPTLGVNIIQGRNFDRSFASDTSAIIINQTAAKIMDLDDPVGQTITYGQPVRIIGVVEDFNFASLHSEVAPAIFYLSDNLWNIYARIQSDHISETIAQIQTEYEQFNPGYVFDYDFQDEQYARMYRSEERVATLSQYFAIFAILISCLGLFGLASFTAERRIKEIGIRKVLGASISGIIVLISKDFSRLVLIAVIIALPLAYLALNQWLERFAYQIDLNVWFFVVAGALAMLIAWLTVSSQAYRAATVNPAECLKDE